MRRWNAVVTAVRITEAGMTTIFFGSLRPGPGGAVRPVAPVLCSVIVVCHLADRRRVTKP